MNLPLEVLQLLADAKLTPEQLTVVLGVIETIRKRKLRAARQARWRARKKEDEASTPAPIGASTKRLQIASTNRLQSVYNGASRVDDNNNLLPFQTETVRKGRKSLSSDLSDPAFETFWSVYPKRAGDRDKKAALKAFNIAQRRVDDPQVIIAGAQRYAAFCDAEDKTNTSYVRQARTWLNADGWTEEYEITPITKLDKEQLEAKRLLDQHRARQTNG